MILNTNFVFFNGNLECHCRLYCTQQVARNMDSNSDPIDERKKGSLMSFSQIWIRNIFSISRWHLPQNQILGKKYISG